MGNLKTLTKALEIITPWIAASGSGAAIGAATAEDRKKGAMRGSLIGLGALAGERATSRITEPLIRKFLGKHLDIAEEFSKLKAAGNKAATNEFKFKHQISDKVKEDLAKAMAKAIFIRGIVPSLGGATGLAGTAYALRNDTDSKKK